MQLGFSRLAVAGFCSLHPKGYLFSANICIHHDKSIVTANKVAIICEIFCNLNIPLVNAFVMNCFAINLLNKDALIILHIAVKRARQIVPTRKLEKSLIYDSLWVSTLILFSGISCCFLKKAIKLVKCHIHNKDICNEDLPEWEKKHGKI